MFCENCGKKLEDAELFCSDCGAKVENVSMEHIDVSESAHTDEDSNTASIFTDDFMEELVDAFILGNKTDKTKKSYLYYKIRFKKLENEERGGFNAACWFFGFFHAFYRKCWAAGIVYFLLGILLPVSADLLEVPFLYYFTPILPIVFGFAQNKIYFYKFVRLIRKLQDFYEENISEYDEEQIIQKVRSQGGTLF